MGPISLPVRLFGVCPTSRRPVPKSTLWTSGVRYEHGAPCHTSVEKRSAHGLILAPTGTHCTLSPTWYQGTLTCHSCSDSQRTLSRVRYVYLRCFIRRTEADTPRASVRSSLPAGALCGAAGLSPRFVRPTANRPVVPPIRPDPPLEILGTAKAEAWPLGYFSTGRRSGYF